MTVTSLSNSAISSQAIFGLNQVTREISDSTARLSSGIRFVNAGDDVGALSSSIRINSQKVALDQAQTNNALADSMLQMAYSGASEISDILDAMNSLAVSANSGALTAAERLVLDLEFQELMDEVDSIAASTSFNDINLLDGSISGEGEINDATTNSTQAAATITFSSAIGAGQNIRINGAASAFAEGSHFAAGTSATSTAANLFAALQASTDEKVAPLSFSLNGASITVTARGGGKMGEHFYIDEANSTGAASFAVTGAKSTGVANKHALSGGVDDAISQGSTIASGTIGDTLITTQAQERSTATLTISNNASLDDNEQVLVLDDGAGGTVSFRGRTGSAATAANEFNIGSSAEITLENLVSAIENYSTAGDLFVIDQLAFEVEGNQLTMTAQQSGRIRDVNSAIADVAEGLAPDEGTISTTFLSSGTDTGVNVDSVTSSGFVGTISGFSATYNGADDITATITIGSDVFTAEINDTTPASDTVTTFSSTDGGSFSVELSGGNGLAVADQTDADTYAARLDAAFSSLSFTQSRSITNFVGSGQLAAGSAVYHSDSFDSLLIEDVSVTDSATTGSDAIVQLTVNGETFRNDDLGESIGSDETFYLRSTSSDDYLAITNGGTGQISLDSAGDATTFASTLRTNFGLDADGSNTLDFQIGASSDDKLSISIGSATADSLFDGATLDITTTGNAATAQTAISAAQDELNGLIAEVGAYQARLGYSYNANASAITELEASYSTLADTDIPSESSAYAAYIVQQQAAIAVLAQAATISSNLLDLLDS